jgi:hypothetical protein
MQFRAQWPSTDDILAAVLGKLHDPDLRLCIGLELPLPGSKVLVTSQRVSDGGLPPRRSDHFARTNVIGTRGERNYLVA